MTGQSREGNNYARLNSLRRRLEARVVLEEQMEQILGEVWRQEVWATTEDRIDALLTRTFPPER
jgi:hypothetical protein